MAGLFLRESFCVFCLNPRTARLGLDRKGRPYIHCSGCGARSFLPLYDCLQGLAVIPPLVEAWMKEVSPEDLRMQLTMHLAELRERATVAVQQADRSVNEVRMDALNTALARTA